MAFRIIADSSCDIFDLDRKIDGLYFNTVPFVITVDGKDFVDDEHLDVNELVEAMAVSSKSHTSCPSPADWVREFGEEGDVFALTISSNLSGTLRFLPITIWLTTAGCPRSQALFWDIWDSGESGSPAKKARSR